MGGGIRRGSRRRQLGSGKNRIRLRGNTRYPLTLGPLKIRQSMARQSTWTVVLRCYNCEENFVVSHVILERVRMVAAVCPCTMCGAKPAVNKSLFHRLVDFNNTLETLYRRRAKEEMWHFVPECSSWPSSEYIELNARPRVAGGMCEECIDRIQVHRSDDPTQLDSSQQRGGRGRSN